MVAPTIANIAGFGSMPLHAMGLIQTPPQTVRENVQRFLTPEPETKIGKVLTEYNPMALIGKGVGKVAEKAEAAIEPPPEAYGTRAEAQRAAARGAGELVRQVPGVVGAKIGGRIEGKIPARQAEMDVLKGQEAPKNAIREAAQASGYKVPADTGVAGAMRGLTGKTRGEKRVSEKNNENAADKLGGEVGVRRGEAITDEVIDALKDGQGKIYEETAKAAGPKLVVTNDFRDHVNKLYNYATENKDLIPGLSAIQRVAQGFKKRIERPEETPGKEEVPIYKTIEKTISEEPQGFRPRSGGTPLNKILEQVAGESPGIASYGERGPLPPPKSPISANPSLDTKWVMGRISDLRNSAKESYRKGDARMGDVQYRMAYQLEDLIEQALQKNNPAQLQQFRDARTQFAKIYLLDRIKTATGGVDIAKLARLTDKPEYASRLSGEFKTASDFARAFHEVARKPTGLKEPPVSVIDGLFAFGTLAARHPLIGAAELAGRYAIPEMMTRGMLQGKTPSYRVSELPPQVARILGFGTTAVSDQIPEPPQ